MDCSESMAYDNLDGKGPRKFDYACWAAAALGYVITQQQDAAGLVLFDEKIRLGLPAQSSAAHLRNVITELENAVPGNNTGMGHAFLQAGETIGRRGLIVVFSDLMDNEEEVLKGLRHLRGRGNEVLLFHILAKDEVTFPFERLTRFEGLEDLPNVTADPTPLREAYLEEVENFRRRLRRVSLANRIDLVEISTQDSLGVVLAAYLAKREARRRAS